MRRWTRVVIALGACGLSGCASIGGDDEVTARVSGPAVLTKAQVNRYPDGSPARTVFAWWRELQFDNPVTAARYYRAGLRITPERLDRQLQWGAAALGLTGRPRLVGVDENGNSATVRVLLRTSIRNPNGRIDTAQTARGFNLVREHGKWKLAENMYIDRGVRIQRAFQRAAALRLDAERRRQGAPESP